MFGFTELPKVTAFVPRRAATRTALAVAGASAVLFVVGGAAHADDCIGGYRMVKGEIPVICDVGGSRALFSPGQSTANEPLYTGSINRSSALSEEQPANAARPSSSPASAASSENSAAACDHGMRFVETPNNGATLMIKCS